MATDMFSEISFVISERVLSLIHVFYCFFQKRSETRKVKKKSILM